MPAFRKILNLQKSKWDRISPEMDELYLNGNDCSWSKMCILAIALCTLQYWTHLLYPVNNPVILTRPVHCGLNTCKYSIEIINQRIIECQATLNFSKCHFIIWHLKPGKESIIPYYQYHSPCCSKVYSRQFFSHRLEWTLCK